MVKKQLTQIHQTFFLRTKLTTVRSSILNSSKVWRAQGTLQIFGAQLRVFQGEYSQNQLRNLILMLCQKHPYFYHAVMFLALLENTLEQDVTKPILNTLWNEEKEKSGIAKHGAGKEGTVSPPAVLSSPAMTSSFLCRLHFLCNCWFFLLVPISTTQSASILLLQVSICS